MKLVDIANRIKEHLARFEADPEINKPRTASGTKAYYMANSWVSGRWVYVKYIGYQNESNLSKEQAEAYLAWLDAGGIGTHYRMQAQTRA